MAYISGLASGIDTEVLIKQLLELERRPAQLMQARQSSLELRRDAYRDVNTRLRNLVATLDALVSVSAFQTKKVTSSNPQAATATAGTSASPGSYDLIVTQLARAHRIASSAQADSTSALGLSGTVSINGVSVEITSDMSLNAIRAAINNAKAGVTASILNNTLVLESVASGAGATIELIDAGGPVVVLASSTNEAVLTATSDATAQPASHVVEVYALATNHTVQGQAYGDTTAALGLSGTFSVNGVSISVGSGDSLEAIRDAINAAGAGVTAAIDGGRLVLTSDETGVAGRIGAEDVSGTVLQSLGILHIDGTFLDEMVVAQDAAFKVDGVQYTRSSNIVDDVIQGVTITFASVGSATVELSRTGGGGPLTDLGLLDEEGGFANELQSPQDARFTLNGVEFTRSSNTVNDALPGVSFSLLAVGSTTVTVGRDVQHAIDLVQKFVDQYNSAQDFIRSKIAKDEILQGDSVLIRLQSMLQIRAMDRIQVSAENPYNSLAMVGISVDKDGFMLLDVEKLRKALEDHPEEVQALFAARSATDGVDGIATSLRSFLRTFTETGTGILSTREKLFRDQIESLRDAMERVERRLKLREQNLIRQFTEMERALSSIQNLSVALSGQIAQLTAMTST